MFLIGVLGFWLLGGVAFFGWRRLANSKGLRVLRVVPRSDGRRG
jgi:hypothetical protein